MLSVPGGRLWYRVVGSGPGTPLLVIHGGPGGVSCVENELGRLGIDRPVIFYDQLGTGHSERPADSSYWNLAHFVSEVDAIRQQLGLRELHLFGHSWGGAVAAEYVLTHGTEGVRSLILAAPLLSTPKWLEDAKVLVAQLPPEQQQAIAAGETTGRYDDSAYRAANDTFSARYFSRSGAAAHYAECRTSPKGNRAMYNAMWGPSEFSSTGTLRNYDRSTRLHELRLPVLLIGGQYDEARPDRLREYQQSILGARVAIIPDAGHMMMADKPELTLAALRTFLREVEQTNR
ncbi:MAG: proline iminopeptidase-family hydrolase [bacterium]